MREIKFRIWCKQQGEMFEVKNLRFDNNELWYAEDYENEVPYYFDNKDCELMQYTGLKDKNGIEIYEGDILSDEDYTNIKDVVRFEDGKFKCIGYDSIFDDFDDFNLEVIGNIYENPELT